MSRAHVQLDCNFDIQVCATYYDQHKVTAEIKTVQAVFEKSCKDEKVNIYIYISFLTMMGLMTVLIPPVNDLMNFYYL